MFFVILDTVTEPKVFGPGAEVPLEFPDHPGSRCRGRRGSFEVRQASVQRSLEFLPVGRAGLNFNHPVTGGEAVAKGLDGATQREALDLRRKLPDRVCQ